MLYLALFVSFVELRLVDPINQGVSSFALPVGFSKIITILLYSCSETKLVENTLSEIASKDEK